MSSNGNILVLGSAPRSAEAGQGSHASSQDGQDGAPRRRHAKQADSRVSRRAHAKGAVAAIHEPVAANATSKNRAASSAVRSSSVRAVDAAADASEAAARAAAREEARAKRAAARERAAQGESGSQGEKRESAKGFSLFASKASKDAKAEKGATRDRATKGRGAEARTASAREESRAANASASAKDRAAAAAGNGAQGILAWFMGHKKLSIVLIAILALAIAVYPPACSLYSATRSNAILSEKLTYATTTADSLQSEVDSLMTREGIEDEARRRGYVSEGETAVEMDGVEDTGSASSDSTVTESSNADAEEDPWYIKALDFIFGYDASTQGLGK